MSSIEDLISLHSHRSVRQLRLFCVRFQASAVLPATKMAWPWEFLDLSPDERHARRLVLDRYGHYGALFSASPVLIMLLVRIVQWAVALTRTFLIRRGFQSRVGNFSLSGSAYNVIPDSPSLKLRRLTARGSWEKWLRRTKWWLSDDVVVFGQRLGQRDLWVGGALWMAVLLLLCVVETGRGK